MKIYVTFGQAHIHEINDNVLDKDCVAVFESEDYTAGRAKAFELFGRKFSFIYSENDWDIKDMSFYHRGYIDVS